MKINKSIAVLVVLMGAFSFFLSVQAQAGPVVLKLSHQWATSDARAIWGVKWAELVAEKSDGQIKVELFPAGSLYKSKMQYDAMRRGNLDACLIPNSYLEGKMPQVGISSLPTIIKDSRQGLAWSRNEIGKRLNKLSNKNGFDIVSWAYLPGSIAAKGKAVVRPEDLNGMKVRGASRYYEAMMREAGASITSMPSSEVYFGCQTGVLDGMITTYSSFVSYRLYEVVDHLSTSQSNDLYGGFVWLLVANKTLDKLSPEQRKILAEAGREVEPMVLDMLLDAKAKCVQAFKDHKVTIDTISDEDFAAWKEVAKRSAWKMFKERVKGGEEWIELANQVTAQ